MVQVMLDLETLGTAPGSVVLSIGACEFYWPDGIIGRTFHRLLNVEDQLARGLTMDFDTIRWWMKQSDDARALFTKEVVPAACALVDFTSWLSVVDNLTGLWAHGATFDPPLLEIVYRKFGYQTPWPYHAVRDTRTLFSLCGKKMGDFGTPNVLAHDALEDAIYQAKETIACLRSLNSW